jgi:hypothetical protein
MVLLRVFDWLNGAVDGLSRLKNEFRNEVKIAIKAIRKNIMLTLFEVSMYIVGAMLILAGIVVFLSRFFEAEYVMLVLGVVLVYAGFLFRSVR